MTWADKFAKAQREGAEGSRMARQFKCEACHCVEHSTPHTYCVDCSYDYKALREMATKLRETLKRWDLSPAETIRAAYNRLVAKLEAKK